MEIAEAYVRPQNYTGRPDAAVRSNEAALPATEDQPGTDPLDLSADAESFLNHTQGPGNATQSPAHRARALVAEYPHLAALPFGQVVSGLVRGNLDLTPPSDPVDLPADGLPVDTAPTAGTEIVGIAPVSVDEPENEGEPETEALLDENADEPSTLRVADGGTDIASILADGLTDEDEGLSLFGAE